MDLQAYTQDRLIIVNGADLEYTNKNTFKIAWWTMLCWSIYIKKEQKLKTKFRSIIILNLSANLADRTN